MHRSAISVGVVATVMALAFGCAERKSPTDSQIQAHPQGWAEPASEPFHGTRVGRDGADGCRGCHGTDLRGKGKANDCSQCHLGGAGGHPASQEWLTPTSGGFHGLEVEREGPAPCSTCHGEDFRGGWSGVSCYLCHAGGPSGHPEGWLAPASPRFHGQAVFDGGQAECMRCHGSDLGGGTSGLACSLCHS
jgi:hypothetical protein